MESVRRRQGSWASDESPACNYHTLNDVFSRCKSVHKMATGKSDDDLIQQDNKMRIGTRSGKFRKVENPELSMAWVTKHDADVNDNINNCVALHDACTTDHFHRHPHERSAHSLSFSLISVTSSAHALRLKTFESFHSTSSTWSCPRERFSST